MSVPEQREQMQHFKGPEALSRVRVWDAPTRIFHWLLALLLAGAWYTGGDINQLDRHKWIGYGLLTLLLFRVAWGVVGTHHARFANFIAGPRRVAHHARTLPRRAAPSVAGHNPLGGWSVAVMLALLFVQALTGLFTHEDVLYQHGPLYPAVSSDTAAFLGRIHRNTFDFILAVVALHLAAVAFYSLWKRSDMVLAMFTGVKRLPTELARESVRGSRWGWALAAALLAAAAVGAMLWLAPEATPSYFF